MKKYRLKEEVKKYLDVNISYYNQINNLSTWENLGFTLEALEEVEERIELRLRATNVSCGAIIKSDELPFNDKQLELCEKALNGELFTKDDMEAFLYYSRRIDNINSPTNMLIKDFIRMNNDDY